MSGDRQRRCEMIKGNVTGVWSGEEVVCEGEVVSFVFSVGFQ